MYNQRIEVFENQSGPRESREIVTIILSDGNWPAGDPETEEGYTDYNHLDLYKKDVPALIEKLQRIMEG